MLIPKLTEQETSEVIAWINEMSKTGCLCLKYTFLRELHLRHRPTKSGAREAIAGEKRWTELVTKNK